MSIIDFLVQQKTTDVSVMRLIISLLNFQIHKFFHQTLNSTHDDHCFQKILLIIITNVIVIVDYDLKNKHSVTSFIVHRR